MDKVRVDKDIATFEDSGIIWVLVTIADNLSPGKISTFANPGSGKNGGNWTQTLIFQIG